METTATGLSTARCYRCGTPNILVICHHCSRGICEAHSEMRSTWRLTTPFEFSNLPLDSAERANTPVHCDDCAHHETSATVVIVGACTALAFLGLWALQADGVASATLRILVIAFTAVASAAIYRRNAQHIVDRRPPVPLVPRVDHLGVVEWYGAEATLGPDGSYAVDVLQPSGNVEVEAAFTGADVDRMEAYRKKYRVLGGHDLPLRSGYVVYMGETRKIRVPCDESTAGIGLALDAMASDFPYLDRGDLIDEKGNENRADWRQTFRYDVRPDPTRGPVPISVVPALSPDKGRKALSLRIQWSNDRSAWAGDVFGHGGDDGPLGVDGTEPRETQLTPKRIRHLSVRAPAAFGAVTDHHQPLTMEPIIEGDKPRTAFSYHDLPLSTTQTEEVVTVEFRNSIEPDAEIEGEVVVEFAGSLSGVDGARWFHPTGAARKGISTDVRSEVWLYFRLSMRSVGYHSLLVLPDEASPAHATRHDVLPDHSTAIGVIDELEAADFHVQSVAESVGSSAAGGDLLSHRWDISGRRLLDLNPVNFTIVLTGERPVDGHRSVARKGRTEILLSAQGEYATEQTFGDILQTWRELLDLLTNRFATMAGDGRRHSDPALPAGFDGSAVEITIVDPSGDEPLVIDDVVDAEDFRS